MKKIGRLLPFFIFSVCCAVTTNAQHCDKNQFALRYKAIEPFDCRASCTNSRNELTILSNFPYGNSTLSHFTAQGNLLWSKELTGAYVFYNTYYAHLVLDVLIPGPDDSYYLSGMVNGDKPQDPNYPLQIPRGIVLQVNHFGAVMWSRLYQTITEFPGLMLTPQGKLVGYCYGGDNKPKILSLTPSTGGIEWVASVNSDRFSIRPGMRPAMTTLGDGTIVVADALTDDTAQSDLHFFAVRGADGMRVFEASYEYPDQFAVLPPQFQSLSLLPDGSISAITSLFTSTPSHPATMMRCLEFVLNTRGEKQGVYAYYPSDGSGVNAVSVTTLSDGSRAVLGDHNGRTNLFLVGPTHSVQNTAGYENAPGAFSPAALSVSGAGYQIVAENIPSKEAQLLLPDPGGQLDCARSDIRYTSEEVPWAYDSYRVFSQFGGNDNEQLSAIAYPITPSEFPILKNTDCSVLGDCCVDVIDSLHTRNIVLCEGSAYRFPDGSAATDSGIYTISTLTEKGCDSVAYFHLETYKDPANLHLTPDTCLGNAPSIRLHATPGYGMYNWMGMTDTASSYVASVEGLYTLTVTNKCGTKTDSVNVFRKCDYTIVMPNAFSPDNNGKNDVFRIPPIVKNRLISFSIYDRWGQRVFFSNDVSRGWDGRVNSMSQPVGGYVYNIIMEGLSGKTFSQSGTFLLIR